MDYQNTYSPVVRYAAVRYFLSLAAMLDLVVYKMDAGQGIWTMKPEDFRDDNTVEGLQA